MATADRVHSTPWADSRPHSFISIDTLAAISLAAISLGDILAGVGLGTFSVIGAVFWMAMAAPVPV